jgi:hypothetical protein
MYLGVSGSRRSAKALRIWQSFFRLETWLRQSRKLLPLIRAKPLPPMQH